MPNSRSFRRVPDNVNQNRVKEKEPLRLPVVFPVLAVLFSLIGLADSVYLTVNHYNGEIAPCSLVTGCEKVLSSEFSQILGIPISALGALSYFLTFSLATFAFNQNRLAWHLMIAITAGMAGFSIWLLYLQAFVIGAFCQFCLISAGSSIALFLTGSFSLILGKFANR